MQLKLFAFFALFAVAIAAPVAEPEPNNTPPPKPTKPTKKPQPTVKQTNQCGNNASPYCCTTDSKGAYVVCSAMSLGSVCSQTTVCCNNNNGIQVCLGNAIIN